MIIEHDLLRKQKTRKYNLKIKVDLYAYATDLYKELDALGMIQRMSDIPHLGVIKVPKKLEKTRFDYIVLQLYFHQLIKSDLQSLLKLTYNNVVKSQEFLQGFCYLSSNEKPSVGDLLQLLTIIYNIGHFYNTFVASRAAIMLSDKDSGFYNLIVQSSTNLRFQTVAKKLLSESNYHRFHLLNSLLVLERCDQSKQSVIIAQELIYAYLNETQLEEQSKLHYVFELFRSIRSVSYVAYDLQIASTPLIIDLCNDKALLVLFRELLSEYNDRISTSQLVESISKMLDDAVYNENSNAICYYKVSNKIVVAVGKRHNWSAINYYSDFWKNTESVFNIRYPQNRDYSPDGILKLTFKSENKELSNKLFQALERINYSRVGYYDRHHGERTLLVSIKKNCENKVFVALRILKTVISQLREISDIANSDPRYLLSSKFFIYYFCTENPIVIKPTIDKTICVLCDRGKHQRIQGVKSLLKKSLGTKDERYEVEFICSILQQDIINDTTIIIPGSILVYEKERSGKTLCEFDGMIIYPLRKEKQVVFLEAKNTSDTPSYGKKCLSEKLDKLNIAYEKSAIEIVDKNAYLKMSIK
jgi:hypothetical protein